MSVYKIVLMSGVTSVHMCEMEITSAGHTANEHNVYMTDPTTVYTACVDYHPYFTSTGTTDYPSLMSIGNMVLTTGTIGAYVIDWHFGTPYGTIILISGDSFGSDPSIQQEHPFSNVPVPGGILYPVIRWVVINGISYSSTLTAGMRYSPDLYTCLNPITVKNLTCYNGVNPAPGQGSDPYGTGTIYTSQFHYDYLGSSSSESTKTISFVLNTGGTTKYLCWYFKGYNVYDTLKIKYVNIIDSSETILDWWSIGTDVGGSDYISSPKKYNGTYLQYITNLTGISYNTGDYLKIEITPNPTNPATNWDLYTLCRTGFTCNVYPDGYNILVSNSFSMSKAGCYYYMYFSTASGGTYTNSDMSRYLNSNGSSLNGTSMSANIGQVNTAYTYSYANYNISCLSLVNTLQVVKFGTGITLTFANSTDYNYFKSNYHTTTGFTNMSNYSGSNNNILHFKNISLYLLSGSSCGDNISLSLYFHYSSTVQFNDTNKTIYIGLLNTTNGLTEVTCNTDYSTANSMIAMVTNTLALSNFTWTATYIKATNPFYGLYEHFSNYNTLVSPKEVSSYEYIHPVMNNNVCNLTDWVYPTGGTYNTGYYYKFKYRFLIEITNMSSPTTNFKIYDGLHRNGYPTQTWPTTPIYQIP